MNLLEAMQTEPPDTVEFPGMSGALGVRFGLASDLSRTIRFGGTRFGLGQHLTVRGVEIDCAGIYFYEQAGAWLRAGYDGFRRPGTMSTDVPLKTTKAIVEAMTVQCARLAEQFPEAFDKVGFENDYSTASSSRSAAVQLAKDAAMFSQFAEIAEGVEDGTLTVRKATPGDDVPEQIRWNKPRSRDFHVGSIDVSQPRTVVGLVLDGKTPVGYVVDTRGHHHPDCYQGPLLLPLDLAVAVNQSTTSW